MAANAMEMYNGNPNQSIETWLESFENICTTHELDHEHWPAEVKVGLDPKVLQALKPVEFMLGGDWVWEYDTLKVALIEVDRECPFLPPSV